MPAGGTAPLAHDDQHVLVATLRPLDDEALNGAARFELVEAVQVQGRAGRRLKSLSWGRLVFAPCSDLIVLVTRHEMGVAHLTRAAAGRGRDAPAILVESLYGPHGFLEAFLPLRGFGQCDSRDEVAKWAILGAAHAV